MDTKLTVIRGRRSGDEAVLVSVVVPTYRRPQMLERCLTALLAQDLAPGCYEVIVCDDGPDEATRKVIRRMATGALTSGPRLRYVPVAATQGPAGARNAGWRVAHGAIIAFTDDDTIPDRAWLSCGLRAMVKGVDALAGRIKVPLPAQPTDYERDAAGLADAEFATANCFVRREMLERVGGFDVRYTAAWREDSDLQFSIIEAGGRIGAVADAVVQHPVRPGPWGVSMAQQRKSQFDALLYKKHGHFYRARVEPPRDYHFIVLSLLVAVVAAATGWGPLAIAALIVWGCLTAGFLLRRLMGTSHAPSHVAEMLWTSLLIPPLSVFWRLRGALRFRVVFL